MSEWVHGAVTMCSPNLQSATASFHFFLQHCGKVNASKDWPCLSTYSSFIWVSLCTCGPDPQRPWWLNRGRVLKGSVHHVCVAPAFWGSRWRHDAIAASSDVFATRLTWGLRGEGWMEAECGKMKMLTCRNYTAVHIGVETQHTIKKYNLSCDQVTLVKIDQASFQHCRSKWFCRLKQYHHVGPFLAVELVAVNRIWPPPGWIMSVTKFVNHRLVFPVQIRKNRFGMLQNLSSRNPFGR